MARDDEARVIIIERNAKRPTDDTPFGYKSNIIQFSVLNCENIGVHLFFYKNNFLENV